MTSPSSPSPTSLTFAGLLRQHRAVAGMTQEELATQAHLSVDAISTLERGTRRAPRKDTVALLAEALALAPEERAALALAARRSPSAGLAATPREEPGPGRNAHDTLAAHNGHTPAPAATDLPHGTVTFLFADIEGSTRLLQRLGSERYAEVLAEVQGLLRPIWTAHAGHELGTQEDHFFVVFADSDDALAAAAAAQRALATQSWPELPQGKNAQIHLRMGVHSGAALLTVGRYVGLEVQRATRIAAAGHGGQIVVSQAVVDHVTKFGYALPEGTRLRDLGAHRLPGLNRHERLSQLVMPSLPGLPTTFPPLQTLDVWPEVRANLVVVSALTLALLAVAGLLLPLIVPTFPRALGLIAGGAALALLAAVALARPLDRALATQWREARKGVVAVVSLLLSAVVVLTTLFITKPALLTASQRSGYDFTYTYHPPTHQGGEVVIGTGLPIHTLIPPILNGYLPDQVYRAVWNACVAQLPDLKLPYLEGWKADQCVRVPTIANGDESLDSRTTIFHIDPRAVWSDGQPLIADDFLFAFHLITDPNVEGTVWVKQSPQIIPPWTLMHLSKLDARTVRIAWSVPYGDYLAALAQLTPLPLHVYARGQYSGVYDPATGAYNSKLAQQMAAEDSFNLHIPVDNGPFMVQRVEGYPGMYQANEISTAQRLVLARNPRFFSNFFHTPALDRVTFVTKWTIELFDHPEVGLAARDALLAAYRQGDLTLDDMLGPLDLSRLGGIPTGEVVINPAPLIITMGYNQRSVAPNARANGGVSIFADLTLRRRSSKPSTVAARSKRCWACATAMTGTSIRTSMPRRQRPTMTQASPYRRTTRPTQPRC